MKTMECPRMRPTTQKAKKTHRLKWMLTTLKVSLYYSSMSQTMVALVPLVTKPSWVPSLFCDTESRRGDNASLL